MISSYTDILMEFLADLQMESPTVPTENLARQIKRKWLSEPGSTANNYTVQLYSWIVEVVIILQGPGLVAKNKVRQKTN